jgi:hypothetical protein
MVSDSLRKALTKQGYKVVGSHSGVKLCRWTKAMLRGRGGCYKHTFYGIASYQCMEVGNTGEGWGGGRRVGLSSFRSRLSHPQRSSAYRRGPCGDGRHRGMRVCSGAISFLLLRAASHPPSLPLSISRTQATPSLACANKCVFCWRHHDNPVGTSFRWEVDDPTQLVRWGVYSWGREGEEVLRLGFQMWSLAPPREVESRSVRRERSRETRENRKKERHSAHTHMDEGESRHPRGVG